MMISEGSGIQADSMAISSNTPAYPLLEITATMIPASQAIIFSIIRWDFEKLRLETRPLELKHQNSALEFVLGEGVTGQGHSLLHFQNLDADGLRLGRADVGRT